MRPNLLHGFLERNPPVLKIEGGHVLVVEDPASRFGRRVEGRDDIVRVKFLEVFDDAIGRLEAVPDGRPRTLDGCIDGLRSAKPERVRLAAYGITDLADRLEDPTVQIMRDRLDEIGQKDDGRWRPPGQLGQFGVGPGGPTPTWRTDVLDTCFALLFLKRATIVPRRPVLDDGPATTPRDGEPKK